MLCGFAISYDGLLLKIACTKDSRKLMSSWKYHGKRSLFYHCKKFFMKVCFFLTGGAVTRFAIWLAGSIYWNRFVFHSDSWNRSLIINDIINVCRYFWEGLHSNLHKKMYWKSNISEKNTFLKRWYSHVSLNELNVYHKLLSITRWFHSNFVKEAKTIVINYTC